MSIHCGCWIPIDKRGAKSSDFVSKNRAFIIFVVFFLLHFREWGVGTGWVGGLLIWPATRVKCAQVPFGNMVIGGGYHAACTLLA